MLTWDLLRHQQGSGFMGYMQKVRSFAVMKSAYMLLRRRWLWKNMEADLSLGSFVPRHRRTPTSWFVSSPSTSRQCKVYTTG